MTRIFVVLCLLVLTACAPRVQNVGPEVEPPSLTENALETADGVSLTVRRWGLEIEKPKAIIIAAHGFNDYGNAFAMPGEWFARRGVATISLDQRGFGADPQAGIWPGTEQIARDFAELSRQVRKEYPHVPLHLMGESMGGAVVITAVTADAAAADSLILVAPAVWGWSTLNPFYATALWVSAHVAPGWKLTGGGLDIQPSDNIEMLRALGRDPLVIKETRTDAIYGLVGLMDKALKSAGEVNTPTLLLYGERDDIIPKKPIARLEAALPEGTQIIRYDGGYHMLLRDLDRVKIYRDILDFMGIEDLRGRGQAPPFR